MVNDSLINAGDFAAITELTRKAVAIVMGFELAHVGINSQSGDEALATANLLSAMFGFQVKEGNSSVFAGPVEVMKEPYRAANGHVAIRVNDLSRACLLYTSFHVAFWSKDEDVIHSQVVFDVLDRCV